jgi:hypothetical protein
LSLESTIKGILKDRVFQGTYQTRALGSGERVDSGRWQAAAETK